MDIDVSDFYLTRVEFMDIYKKLKEKEVDQELLNLFMLQIDWMDTMLIWNSVCPHCGYDINRELKFYEDSGTEIKYICEGCGREYEGNEIK